MKDLNKTQKMIRETMTELNPYLIELVKQLFPSCPFTDVVIPHFDMFFNPLLKEKHMLTLEPLKELCLEEGVTGIHYEAELSQLEFSLIMSFQFFNMCNDCKEQLGLEISKEDIEECRNYIAGMAMAHKERYNTNFMTIFNLWTGA